LTPVDISVYGLGGSDIIPARMIDLKVTAGTKPKLRTETVTFLVLKKESTYNVILGQPAIDAFKMVISQPYQRAKFKTEHGIGEVRGCLEEARRCRRKSTRRKEALPIDAFDVREDLRISGVPAEPTLKIPIGEADCKKTLQVSSGLKEDELGQLTTCLRSNQDLFAWKPSDMPGLDPSLICLKLNVNTNCRPVRQKKRSFVPERSRVIKTELQPNYE
jgi:hypothetical protein